MRQPTWVQFITVSSTRTISCANGTISTTLLKIRRRSTREPSRWKDKKRRESKAKRSVEVAEDTELLNEVQVPEREDIEVVVEIRSKDHGQLSQKQPTKLRENREDCTVEDSEMTLTETLNLQLIRPMTRTRFTLSATASTKSI